MSRDERVEAAEYVDARPFNGYLTHAVRNQPAMFTRTAPFIMVTYSKALCGVGRGGMRISLDKDGAPKPYMGIDGCNSCAVKVRKIRDTALLGEGE